MSAFGHQGASEIQDLARMAGQIDQKLTNRGGCGPITSASAENLAGFSAAP